MQPVNPTIAFANSIWLVDLAIYICAFGIALVVTLLWVFKSQQTIVDPTRHLAWMIAARLAAVFGVGYAISALIYSTAPGIIILMFAFILFLFTAVGSAAGFLGIPLFFGIQQFVLGFPARHALVNRATTAPDKHQETTTTRDTLIGKHAITVTPLRPAGEVQLGDKRYEAQSENVQFIDVNTKVTVRRKQGDTLLVAVLDKTNSNDKE